MGGKLTDKQRAFVAAYLDSPDCRWNATRAAEKAGYSGSDAVLATVGSENLRKPKIRAAIEERMSELAMSADEVLLRLGSMAKGEAPTKRVVRTGEDSGSDERHYDQAKALELVGKAFGLFKEQIEVSGELRFKGYETVGPDDWNEDDER